MKSGIDRAVRIVVVLAVAASAAFAFGDERTYDLYAPIVLRQMFGEVPLGFDPSKPPEVVSSAEQRKLEEERKELSAKIKSAIRFSMCNVTPEGATAVGFTDSSDSKAPKHYYLKVGESRDGWTVKEADPAAATMTIVKGIDTPDAIEVSLTIGGDSSKGAGTTTRANQPNVGAEKRMAAGAPAGERDGMLGSLRGRRSLRKEEDERNERERRERAEREAKREAEREAKRDAERAQQNQQLTEIFEELKKIRENPVKKDSEEKDTEKGDE